MRKLHLLYHELRTSRSPYSYVIEVEEFKRQVDFFAETIARDSELHPYLTFDDGHISNFEHALPILQSRGMKAQFFITVGWTGHKSGYMGWQELRTLHAAGQSIGAHGWTHTLLTHCGEKELLDELGRARLMLEDKLGAPITTMSLPGGRYNRHVLAACQQAGYTQIYTSIPRSEPMSLGLTIGRLNIRKDMKLEWIADLFKPDSSTLRGLGFQYQMKAAAQTLMGDRAYGKLWALLNRKDRDTDPAEITRE